MIIFWTLLIVSLVWFFSGLIIGLFQPESYWQSRSEELDKTDDVDVFLRHISEICLIFGPVVWIALLAITIYGYISYLCSEED